MHAWLAGLMEADGARRVWSCDITDQSRWVFDNSCGTVPKIARERVKYGSTQATPYLCMGQRGQHRQHHTILYLCMGQRGQHRQRHTYVWVNAVNTGNTGNAILMYGSTRSTQATPYLYLCMGQHGQHRQHRQRHTYVWVNAVNTGNTGYAILMYGPTRSTQATPYWCIYRSNTSNIIQTYGNTEQHTTLVYRSNMSNTIQTYILQHHTNIYIATPYKHIYCNIIQTYRNITVV